MPSLVAEKVEQAIGILNELAIDCWLTFVRETTDAGDPVVPLILGQNLTWQSALILGRNGQRIAIVGKHEEDPVRCGGVWTEVVPYVQSVRQPLVEALIRLNPGSLAVNYSTSDVKADGLSHGMFLLLQDYLGETPFRERMISAEGVVGALRGRKTPAELQRIRTAIATAEEIFAATAGWARPGRSEAEVSTFMHDQAGARNLETAWDFQQCPIVTTGPDSMVGHGIPSETLKITPGQIFHVDFGVRQEEYCSDLQRVWYVPTGGEKEPPQEVQQAFDTVRAAITAAAGALKPGTECWQVDQAARQVVINAGYPEYEHATGHHVGRSAHDGAGVLGPRWERYGKTPYIKVEPGNVLTLELGISVEERGYLGLEEMVVVTAEGCAYLSNPQTTLPLL